MTKAAARRLLTTCQIYQGQARAITAAHSQEAQMNKVRAMMRDMRLVGTSMSYRATHRQTHGADWRRPSERLPYSCVRRPRCPLTSRIRPRHAAA